MKGEYLAALLTFVIDCAQWSLIWYLIWHRRPPELHVTVHVHPMPPPEGGTPLKMTIPTTETPEEDDTEQVLH